MNQINRFRHTSWISGNKLFIHGGFEPTRPNIPTGNLYQINLHNALQVIPNIQQQLMSVKIKKSQNFYS